MALTTVITGRVALPTDQPAKAAELVFTLTGWDKAGADIFPPAKVRSVMLLADGSIPAGFKLWRNGAGANVTKYDVTLRWSEADHKETVARETYLGQIYIAGTGPLTLASLLATPPEVPTAPGVLAQALGAAASATAALGEIAPLHEDVMEAASTAIGTPQYASIEAAEIVTVPSVLTQTLIGGRLYHRVESDPHTESSYQDASGAWFSAVELRRSGPIEIWVAWGQSEMRGVTGSPGAISGERSGQSYVLIYSRGNPHIDDGWYAVGPEDEGWAFNTSLIAVGSPWYLNAVARAREIGGTVCVIPYAIGGAESGKFKQGGSMWAGLQASWSAAMEAELPGRNGKSLNDINGLDEDDEPRTRADVALIWQGSADADYKFGIDDAALSGDDWVLNWRTVLNSLQAPSGSSVAITSARTKIIFFEMLHGATSGGAPSEGSPTDDRNKDLHKLLKYTSGKRNQIRIVPMDGVNQGANVTDPEVCGSFDNLHLNGAAYSEVSKRLSFVLDTFGIAAGEGDVIFTNSAGFTIVRPNGTFTSWSADLTVATANVAVGSLYRSSYSLWTIPMPTGYAVSGSPNVSPCQSSALGTWVGIHAVTPSVQAYVLAATSQASTVTLRVQANGFWAKN